ncbi:DUF4145 domain-containing protein [bacterium]|nr:DUF4145 domain-containing protein [bacterium]
MESWWSLGEGIGQLGDKLEFYKITCPFCLEEGNFKVAFHAEKQKPNSSKVLNFDTLECGNCKGYVMVLWSASEHGSGPNHSLYDYRVLPWPLKFTKYPEHWPEQIGRYWLQAKKNLVDENWDAAVVMARTALQIALRDNKAKGSNLKQEIEDLSIKGILPPTMKEWADNVRELGNESVHPEPKQAPTDHLDAKDIIRFLDFLLEYLYTLPYKIREYRKREAEK